MPDDHSFGDDYVSFTRPPSIIFLLIIILSPSTLQPTSAIIKVTVNLNVFLLLRSETSNFPSLQTTVRLQQAIGKSIQCVCEREREKGRQSRHTVVARKHALHQRNRFGVGRSRSKQSAKGDTISKKLFQASQLGENQPSRFDTMDRTKSDSHSWI
jgi:hypothetical protein